MDGRLVETQLVRWNLTVNETCQGRLDVEPIDLTTIISTLSAVKYSHPFQNAGPEECKSYLEFCIEHCDHPRSLPDITILYSRTGCW